MEKYIAFVLHLGFFCKYQIGPKEYKGDALHSSNRFFMCLNSKFDELKQFHFILNNLKKTSQFSGMLGIFLKYKADLRERKTEFMQK